MCVSIGVSLGLVILRDYFFCVSKIVGIVAFALAVSGNECESLGLSSFSAAYFDLRCHKCPLS